MTEWYSTSASPLPDRLVGAISRAGVVLIGEESGTSNCEPDGSHVGLRPIAVLDRGSYGGREAGREGVAQEGSYIISLCVCVCVCVYVCVCVCVYVCA